MTATSPEGQAPPAEMYTCRVCRRDYADELDKCPQCNAWQGDNRVMVEPGPKPPRPAKSTPRPMWTAKPESAKSEPTCETDSADSAIAAEPSVAVYLAAALGWFVIALGLGFLLRESYVIGGILLGAGGLVSWFGVLLNGPDWLGPLTQAIWFLAVPAAGAVMISQGYTISGLVALGVVCAAIVPGILLDFV